ncbi:hypothetical protein [Chryseobacterium sp. Leaf394]|uniref:hypothetical protein n=1 Tax=Chryseobacterium sp. Leaf394 TaxID=1736361 RepID=UPI0006FAEE19|nr:hypothetical protein [Chryseobacterium sp. Leaf394]KQS91964.1 hypothetical protein ASG21_05770 [Chryseobacterium sp. Leaf394]
MKKVISLVCLLFFILSYSQKTFKYKDRHFPARYVLVGRKDTISTRVQNIGYVTHKKFYAETYVGSILTISESGEKQRVQESDIQYMEIIDLEGVKRKLFSSQLILGKNVGLLQKYNDGEKDGYVDYYRVSLTGPLSTKFYPKQVIK